MALITVTTVGYGEIVPLHGFGERLFTGLIALGGFGAGTFLFTSLTVFFLETDLDYTLRRRRTEKQVRKLHSHFIICGFGRIGRNVANEPSTTHRHFVAIDSDEVLLAVRHNGDFVFNPPDEFMLMPGRHVIAMASPQGRQELEGALLPD